MLANEVTFADIQSMDDVSNYFNLVVEQIENNCALTQFERDYQVGALLVGVGNYKDAIIRLEKSFEALVELKTNYVWSSLYCSVGCAYAGALDYIGSNDLANSVYLRLIEFNPYGSFLGDYAVFLHRKRKENKAAERFVGYFYLN